MQAAVVRLLGHSAFTLLAGCALIPTDLFGSTATSAGSGGAATTGGGGGTAGSGGSACRLDLACDGGADVCCDGTTIVSCVEGKTASTTCAEDERCDNAQTTCQCKKDSRRCLDDTAAQLCDEGPQGNEWKTIPCDAVQSCLLGQCIASMPCSVAGQLACSPDGVSVIQCSPDLHYVTVLDCSAGGFAHGCAPLAPGMTPASPQELCVNACFAHGVPLTGKPCDHPPGLPCSYLVCDNEGSALIPDHTDCRPSGQSCTEDAECATCKCKEGACFGANPAPCPVAVPYKCPKP